MGGKLHTNVVKNRYTLPYRTLLLANCTLDSCCSHVSSSASVETTIFFSSLRCKTLRVCVLERLNAVITPSCAWICIEADVESVPYTFAAPYGIKSRFPFVEVIYMKVKTTMFSMRLPDDLREKLEAMATREGRTLTNLIIYLLRKAVEE